MTKEGDFGRFIILTGATASGKTDIKNALEERGIKRLVTATTRSPRTGEVHGVDYHFLDHDEFVMMKEDGAFIETAPYNKHWYGTPKSELDPLFDGVNLVTSTEIQGAVDFAQGISESYDEVLALQILARTSLVLVGIDSLHVARARFMAREKATKGAISPQSREDIRGRLSRDWEMWQEHKDKFHLVIPNRTGLFEMTVNEVAELYND